MNYSFSSDIRPDEQDWARLWFSRDATPRLIVGPRLELLDTNGAAERLLRTARPEGWRELNGRLGNDPALERRLRALVHQARAKEPLSALIGRTLFVAQRLGPTPHDPVGLTLRDAAHAALLEPIDLEPELGLTKAEQTTLLLLMRGLSAKEIATTLNNSVLTVRTHLKHVHAKLGVCNREQLLARAFLYMFIH